jgi:hypothetical protein
MATPSNKYVKSIKSKVNNSGVNEIFITLTKLSYNILRRFEEEGSPRDHIKHLKEHLPKNIVYKGTVNYSYFSTKMVSLDNETDKITNSLIQIDELLKKQESKFVKKNATTAQLLSQLKENGYKVVKNPSGSITLTKIKASAKK